MVTVITRRLISLYPKTLLKLCPPSQNCSVISNSFTSNKNPRSKYSNNWRAQKETLPGSKYAPLSPLETAEEFISSALSDKVSMADEDWDDFKSDLIDKQHFISEDNFSSIVMNTLSLSNQLDLSHNFLKYVEKSNVKPNFLTYLKYASLCSKNRNVVDQEFILRILDKVMDQIDSSPVLDLKRAELVIRGLCATDRWRESFKYLDKLVRMKPNHEICDALACAAIRNGDEKLAWEILTKWVNTYEFAGGKVFEEFLTVALRMQKISCWESDKFVEKVFRYIQMHNMVINLDVAKLIQQYFLCHRHKWDITFTKVSRKGVCENCYYNLELLELKNNEFEDLRESFLKRVLMKSDLYINTNKKEFNDYINFIQLHKPFHIVVDGLNAAYSFPGKHTRRNLSAHLLNVIRKMSGKTRKILVLGRHHMKNWPGFQNIYDRAKVFFTDNISQDDPFVVYAALASGPHTLFLSSDLMRDHISRFEDPKLIKLFKKWQLSHQMFIQRDSDYDIKFIEPLRHSIVLQGSFEEGWHIPYDDKIILDTYEELNNWICIKKIIE